VERAKNVPLDEQSAEMDASRGTSAQKDLVDTQSTGAVPVPKGQAKIVPAETALPDTQSVGCQSSEGPQVKPDTAVGKIAAVEGRLFWSLLGRGLIVAVITHFRIPASAAIEPLLGQVLLRGTLLAVAGHAMAPIPVRDRRWLHHYLGAMFACPG